MDKGLELTLYMMNIFKGICITWFITKFKVKTTKIYNSYNFIPSEMAKIKMTSSMKYCQEIK